MTYDLARNPSLTIHGITQDIECFHLSMSYFSLRHICMPIQLISYFSSNFIHRAYLALHDNDKLSSEKFTLL